VQGAQTACLCVYAGNDRALLDSLERERIPCARYIPVLDKASIPQCFHRAIGAFLKLELALLPELADFPYCLYCDVDVLFLRPLDELLALRPRYMAMAREQTAPFFHEHERLGYTWRGKDYTVPMPFPIWTFSSGVALFHLQRLRRHDHIHNFLAFCAQNLERIGNLDQSLLNYFFGKRIEKLESRWNCPPYRRNAAAEGHIIHFHGPKPWEIRRPLWDELRIHDFWTLRQTWKGFLDAEELKLVAEWEASD
jgi:lipopolysaccharide biosynthesis glycosyltransferase